MKNMKGQHLRVALTFIATLLALLSLTEARAARERPIVLGQTEGFADDKLVIFDYTRNFFCSNAPLNEADCVIGLAAKPDNVLGLDPDQIPDLVIIVPFFDADHDGVLDAFDPSPGVFVQCPENQSSVLNGGKEFGQPFHCVLHDVELDTAPLAGVQIAGVTFGGKIPLPNHTHLVKETPGGSVPWDVSAVLVLNRGLWPDKNGMCPLEEGCLTSIEAVKSAPLGSVVGPVPTTLFLFFGVHELKR